MGNNPSGEAGGTGTPTTEDDLFGSIEDKNENAQLFNEDQSKTVPTDTNQQEVSSTLEKEATGSVDELDNELFGAISKSSASNVTSTTTSTTTDWFVEDTSDPLFGDINVKNKTDSTFNFDPLGIEKTPEPVVTQNLEGTDTTTTGESEESFETASEGDERKDSNSSQEEREMEEADEEFTLIRASTPFESDSSTKNNVQDVEEKEKETSSESASKEEDEVQETKHEEEKEEEKAEEKVEEEKVEEEKVEDEKVEDEKVAEEKVEEEKVEEEKAEEKVEEEKVEEKAEEEKVAEEKRIRR